MQDLKAALVKLAEAKAKRRDLKKIINDQLAQSPQFCEAMEQLVAVRAKKIQVEGTIMATMPGEQQELERLNLEIKEQATLISDITLTMMMKGQETTIEDDGVKYEPNIKITFKKQLTLL